jgi:hypothetical protein
MAIMTRALGRTGANVTILGYGALELPGDLGRGRGPAAQRGPGRRHQLIDTSVKGCLSQ